jgi:hypothetical protein
MYLISEFSEVSVMFFERGQNLLNFLLRFMTATLPKKALAIKQGGIFLNQGLYAPSQHP